MSKNIILVQKEFQVDNQKIRLFKTLPLKPEEMYDFFSKYISAGKYKINHPDFKHIFDYIDSIKLNNNSYLLSLLSIPQSPSDTNGLGNFFGNKMINISNDLQIFPFGNVIRSNLSLISKRSANHPIFIIVSIKGNKNLNDPLPSNKNMDNLKYNSIGNYIIDNWINTITKRYITYVNDIGFNMCVDIRYLKNTNTQTHNNEDNNEHHNEHHNEDHNEDHNNNINLDITNDTINDTINDDRDINNNEKSLNINNNTILPILNTKTHNNHLVHNDTDNKIEHKLENYQIILNKNYYKYQEEIINLKKMIFYLINNNGKMYSNIYYEFSNDFLKSVFGNDFLSFVNK